MILSAQKIQDLVSKGDIAINPFTQDNLKAASYVFTLDARMKVLVHKKYLDSREDPEFNKLNISEDGYELKPGDFAIFYTKETVNLKGKYACFLSTRPTIAQMGLDVIQSSFFAEPNTDNQFALEITNRGPLPVRLYPGTKIVKGVFISVV